MANTVIYESFWSDRLSDLHPENLSTRKYEDDYIRLRREKYAREDAIYRFKMNCLGIAFWSLIALLFYVLKP